MSEILSTSSKMMIITSFFTWRFLHRLKNYDADVVRSDHVRKKFIQIYCLILLFLTGKSDPLLQPNNHLEFPKNFYAIDTWKNHRFRRSWIVPELKGRSLPRFSKYPRGFLPAARSYPPRVHRIG